MREMEPEVPPIMPLMLLRELARPVRDSFRLAAHRADWRRRNPHNFTTAARLFPSDRVGVGNFTYGPLNLHFFGLPDEAIRIGAFCSIASNVTMLAGGEHSFDRASSYPLERHIAAGADVGSVSKGPITIGDDVWIGFGCTILSGVSIGQGAVLGAGSVVASDVPAYGVHAGGRVVKYRFSDDDIAALCRFDWSGLTREEVVANLEMLKEPVTPAFFASDLYRRHLRAPGDVQQ
jgi:acetyltransferase-like isoleucine patch superfamily enzyme